MTWSQHLILIPVLLPLLCGALLILINESRHQLKFVINFASVLVQLAVAIALLVLVDSGFWPHDIGVYLAGNWPAPFGITLVADRLATLMLVLTGLIATAALFYSMKRWSRIGVHFHTLYQLLLMGIHGAFLTHDLFNLFVFFEVMLAASYGLLLHGYNLNRLRAGMQFVAVNLVASFMFLIGVALIYGAAGTLNMADLALRLTEIAAEDMELFKLGVLVLAIAFLVKSAMWPLGFWLPTTYAAASPPAAAMLVLMTKVGVYAILRVWSLAFSDGSVAHGFGYDILLWGGVATIVFGAAGMMSTDEHGRMAGYAAIVSSGTLFAILGLNQQLLVAPALFYLFSSTIVVAAFMLLIELIERAHNPVGAMLAITMEAYEFEETPEQPVGVGIPMALAFLGLSFIGCALVIAGMPPFSGFVAKVSLFHGLLQFGGANAGAMALNLAIMGLIIAAGFVTIISMMRTGVRTFWASGAVPPRLQLSEAIPVSALLLVTVVLTVQAGPIMDFLERASAGLQQPTHYLERVLEESPVTRVVAEDTP